MVGSMKKGLKRCPKCRSSNIHKRSRILLGSGSKKGLWVKLPMDKHERTTKYYRCYKCKYEFDTPLVVESQSEQIPE